MSQSKTHKKIVFSVLLGVAVTPAAFAQVLGGAVNVGGGIGVQTGHRRVVATPIEPAPACAPMPFAKRPSRLNPRPSDSEPRGR